MYVLIGGNAFAEMQTCVARLLLLLCGCCHSNENVAADRDSSVKANFVSDTARILHRPTRLFHHAWHESDLLILST